MAELSMSTASEPDGAPRMAVLDILRGIAILGILFMNINDMGGSLWASFDDIRHIGWTQADQIAWWLREVLANGTARCMLEMLFGAGMVILTERAALAAGGWKVMRRYYVRNLILFLFGCVHIFILLWPGDILHTYGLAAMIAFLFRRLRPRWLIVIGLSLAVVQFGGVTYGTISTHQIRAEKARIEAKQASGQTLTAKDTAFLKERAERKAKRATAEAKSKANIAAEDKGRSATTGDFWSWAQQQWNVTWALETQGLEIAFVWEAAATMLIGAALFKLGIPQGQRSRAFYVRMTASAYCVGVTLRIWAAYEQTRFSDTFGMAQAGGEFARLAMTLGHIGAVNLLVMSVVGAKILKPFEAAGRTALTIYILQTIATLWILYPPFALGLYGEHGWMVLMLTALAINALLLWVANQWVKQFAIAPVEWAWRSIVERRVLPWRRGPRATPVADSVGPGSVGPGAQGTPSPA